MTREADHYARIHEILRSARALTGERLDAYLAGACGSDRSLASEVLELLAAGADENADDAFADRNVDGVRRGLQEIVAGASSAWCPEKIGEYTILRQIGCGGMGVVYEAQQASPRRRVAIKLLHPMHATADRVRRFHREAEVLGRLQHPGIAQIFEAGTYDIGRGPQPFFAMELVDGLDIRTHCARSGLDHATCIELLARVADAVQYAHDRDIIHRDLKPDNVIVDPNGQPRILDFGIARLTSHSAALSSIVTEEGQLVGTLAYMAPEQLSRRPDAITARVDVYALGVLGFELLVGRPLHAIGDLSISQAITLLTSSDPTRAGTIDASLRGDVETILGKALEADPERRYPSAAAFAGDLRRFLAHLPIQARSPSGIYLARKFVRRHRALVAGMVATVLALLGGSIVALVLAHRASVQRDLAIANATLARRNETRAINGLLQSTEFLLDAGRGRDAAVEVRLVPAASRGVAWRLLDRAVPFVMDTRPGYWRFVDDEHLVRVLDDRLVLYSLGEHRTVRELFIGAGIRSLGSPATCGSVPAMSQDEVLLLDLGQETVLERSPRWPDAWGADGAVLPRNDLLRFPEVSDDGRTVLWYTSESEAQVRVEGAVVRTISDLVAIETAHLGPDVKLLLVNRRAEVCVLDVATGAVRFRHAIEPGKFASGYPVRGGALLVDALDRRSSDLRDKMETWDVRRVWRRIAFSDGGPPEGPVDPFSAGFVVTLNDYAACELHYPRDGRFVAISDRPTGFAHLGDTQTGAPLLVRGLTTGHGGTDGDLPFVDTRLSSATVSPSGRRLAVSSGHAQTMIVELDPRVNDPQFDQR